MNPPLSQPPSAAKASRGADLDLQAAETATPWWRVPMVWVVLSGPLCVVLASLATAVVAWRHIDPVLAGARPGHAQPADAVPVPADPKLSLAPAVTARNHAATPRR